MEYTKVKANAWQNIQINAGIAVRDFNPATGVAGAILGATTGGFTFNSNPTYMDFGEDVDNAPPNTKQLKRLQYYDPTASGTFVSIDPELAKKLNGSARIGSNGRITPTHELSIEDFEDFWVIGDYSDHNTGAGTAGFTAVHIMNALNTAGFQWTTGKDAKGQFAFEYHGHYDIENIDVAPFEIYVKAGSGDETPSISLSQHVVRVSSLEGDNNHNVTLIAYTTPADATVTWTIDDTDVATVNNGEVTGVDIGGATVTAKIIDENGYPYTDTCTVLCTA